MADSIKNGDKTLEVLLQLVERTAAMDATMKAGFDDLKSRMQASAEQVTKLQDRVSKAEALDSVQDEKIMSNNKELAEVKQELVELRELVQAMKVRIAYFSGGAAVVATVLTLLAQYVIELVAK